MSLTIDNVTFDNIVITNTTPLYARTYASSLVLNPPVYTPPRTPVPLEPTTPIKPSEALRLGRLVHYQIHGPMWERRGGEVVGSCAVAAISVGMGGTPGEQIQGGWWEPMFTRRARCPVKTGGIAGHFQKSCEQAGTPYHMTIHLNDTHLWKTEPIAQWLEAQGL